MLHVNNYPIHLDADADPQFQELVKFEELTIAESPPDLNMMMPVEVETQYDLSDICLEEVVVEKILSPTSSEKMSENEICKQSPSSWISNYTDPLDDITEFICPPELCTKTKPEKKEPEYDSDDTLDDYVECGEKGLCKCQKMRGREYYEYYTRNKEKEYFTMYPLGRCKLPRGAVLHFTGASGNIKREDLKEELKALGARVEFMDYQRGSSEGWARLSYPYEARRIIKRMIDKKLNIAGADLEFKVLSGKAEKRYHKKVIEAIYQLEEKSRGLGKELRKAGYSYVRNYDPNNNE
ncbi:hypothetical protein PYW08_001260 [Mythimna loreyi]|uniref:Uncharacterized protein n=1 Tax=Mythimna loreyi TaxID=667449 RepID=A0ACC2R0C1_9NEOP|nr:hypothetical protein PYW08_001260 [Mythimna loreyi]